MRRIALITSLILLAAMAQAQVSPPSTQSRVAGRFVAYNYGTWALQMYKAPAGTGSQTFSLSNSTVQLGDGRKVMPFNTNAQIVVGTEVVTVTAVGLGCLVNSVTIGGCVLTASFSNTHTVANPVSSATFGLQEALNDAGASGGGAVTIDSAWANLGGTTTIKNAATLPANTGIEDVRTGAGGGGSGTVSGQVANGIGKATNATTIGAQSALSDDGSTVTSTEPITLNLGTTAAGAPIRALSNQFQDVFQRSAADLGAGWTNYSNGWIPGSGAASGTNSTAGTSNVAAYTGATTTPASQVASVVITSLSSASNYIGPAVQIGGTPATSAQWYHCVVGVTATSGMYLQKFVGVSNAGGGTQVTLGSSSFTPAVGDVITLQDVGNTLTCYRNGLVILQVNDSSSPLTAGYPGVMQVGVTDTISSFTATNPSLVSPSCNANIVADGDSETWGYNLASAYTDSIFTTEGSVPCIANVAVSGKGLGTGITAITSGTIESMIATGTTVVDPLYQSGMKNIVVIWGCTNDIYAGRTAAQCNTDTATYITARHAAGWKVVLVQTLSRTGSIDQAMQQLNKLNASGTGADKIVTLPLALTGTHGYANTTLFQADGVHLTQLGATVFVAPAISAAINSLK